MATRTRIVYKNDGTKEETGAKMTGDGLFGETEAAFHENVNRTYYQLECQGQLPATMKGRTKQAIRDLHVAAQSKSYWEN